MEIQEEIENGNDDCCFASYPPKTRQCHICNKKTQKQYLLAMDASMIDFSLILVTISCLLLFRSRFCEFLFVRIYAYICVRPLQPNDKQRYPPLQYNLCKQNSTQNVSKFSSGKWENRKIYIENRSLKRPRHRAIHFRLHEIPNVTGHIK